MNNDKFDFENLKLRTINSELIIIKTEMRGEK
jgi:hypothetical protein